MALDSNSTYEKFMEVFPYVIKSKKWNSNIVADAFSQRHALISMMSVNLLGLNLSKINT